MPETNAQGETRITTDANPGHVRVEATVDLPPGAEVQITIQYRSSAGAPQREQVINLEGGKEPIQKKLLFELEKIPEKLRFFERVLQKIPTRIKTIPLPFILLGAAIVVYYLVRLIRLSDFPIFFFTDEAVHTILASDLVRDGFKGSGGELFPTFFKSGSTYNAGFPVYLQVIPVLLGIRSVFVTRFISVTVTLLAAIGTGIIFSEVHNRRRAWLAVLVLSIVPAWLYHSRTAFETVEAVSFYTIFLMGYLKYRNGSYRWLIVSVLAAALAFYSYSPARVVMAFIGILLLISDFNYHRKMLRHLWQPLVTGMILIVPYLRFLYLHPGENERHLQLLNSYWIGNQPITWKIFQFLKIYIQGMNPFYWFIPNDVDLPRHVMSGMGHLGWFFFPFFLAGLIITIKKWKQPGYRLLIFALLAAPAGAAVAEIGITRAMFMVIPAAIFTAIGLDYLFDRMQSYFKIVKNREIYLFLFLVLVNFAFLDFVLTNGPLWHRNYGMNGMQYGGQQVFDRIAEIRKRDPHVPIVLSPDWANGTDTLARFFMGDPVPIELASMDAYIENQRSFPANTIFIFTPDDFNKVISSGKFNPMEVVDVLFYPDGTPGFTFAHLKYNSTAKWEFEQEIESRTYMDWAEVTLNGESVKAASSRLDMGILQSVFDNDEKTLVRSLVANPLIVEISFPEPKTYHTALVSIGGSASQISIYVIPEGSTTPLAASISVEDSSTTRTISLPIPTSLAFSRMRVELRTIRDGEPSHVHLWDIGLK
jgi:hypothetical protein